MIIQDKLGSLTNFRHAREIRPALAHEAAKANFDYAYCQPDPRRYFRELCDRLGYFIPELAGPIFSTVATKLEKERGRPLRVLDLGCSYGVNAALLQFPIDLDRLTRRYATLPEGTISPGLPAGPWRCTGRWLLRRRPRPARLTPLRCRRREKKSEERAGA